MKPAPFATILVFLASGGCSIALDEASGVYAAQPGKYDFLDCPGIQQRTQAAAAKETELAGLMDRANQGTAGPVVNALVYRDQMNMVRADRQALQKAADEKRCMPAVKPQSTGLRSLY